MGWKHYQTVEPRKREPQVARGLFGIRLLILRFKFRFSKSIKSSTFHIFLNLILYPLGFAAEFYFGRYRGLKLKTKCGTFLNLAHFFPYDVKL